MKSSNIISNAVVLLSVVLTSCSPVAGPDKSFAGTVLGAGWGSGVGAIVGNQVGAPGAGIAIGAGVSAVSGLITGSAIDVSEGYQLDAGRQLTSLKAQSNYNRQHIADLEDRVTEKMQLNHKTTLSPFAEVFFDEKRASVHRASVERIASIAKQLRNLRYGSYSVELKAYSNDYTANLANQTLNEARLTTIETLLTSYGVPAVAIKKSEYNADKQEKSYILDDSPAERARQNNRVEIYVTL
jgi:hypothetical protein